MKILLLLALTLMTFGASAQTLLLIDGPMSPVCMVMVPLLGLLLGGAIVYGVVKAKRGDDKV